MHQYTISKKILKNKELSIPAKTIYLTLSSYADEDSLCTIPLEELMPMVNCANPSGFYNHFNVLKDLGLVRTTQLSKNAPRTYILTKMNDVKNVEYEELDEYSLNASYEKAFPRVATIDEQLAARDKILYAFLISNSKNKKGSFINREMYFETGIHRQRALKGLEHLLELGYIKSIKTSVKERKTFTSYELGESRVLRDSPLYGKHTIPESLLYNKDIDAVEKYLYLLLMNLSDSYGHVSISRNDIMAMMNIKSLNGYYVHYRALIDNGLIESKERGRFTDINEYKVNILEDSKFIDIKEKRNSSSLSISRSYLVPDTLIQDRQIDVRTKLCYIYLVSRSKYGEGLCTQQQICEDLGIGINTSYRALHDLGKYGYIEKIETLNKATENRTLKYYLGMKKLDSPAKFIY